MPELPEVETLRRDLDATVLGRRVTNVALYDPARVRSPAAEEFCARLDGRTLCTADRRGKYLLLKLDHGLVWAVHLSLEGRLLLVPNGTPTREGTLLVVTLDDGRELRLWDGVSYASTALGTAGELARVYKLDTLGPEPTQPDFTEPLLEERFAKRRGMIKPLLLDQHVLAGVGNIYADESLWRARLGPTRKVSSLTHEDWAALHRALVDALTEGVAHRGTTAPGGLYRDLFGHKGAHQSHLAVFRRAGKPCPRCGTPIARSVVGGRATFVCPSCQCPSKDDPVSVINPRARARSEQRAAVRNKAA